jgi:hypothetical protein
LIGGGGDASTAPKDGSTLLHNNNTEHTCNKSRHRSVALELATTQREDATAPCANEAISSRQMQKPCINNKLPTTYVSWEKAWFEFEGRKTLPANCIKLDLAMVFVSGSGASRIIGGNGNKIKNKITQN